jgi:Ni,Fe-hydrogenase I large subunit
MTKIVIDPITRIEGHLRITCSVENGKVSDAWNTATLFRGFEIFMKNRDPLSVWHFAERICGVCPNPHAFNSVQAVERALGMEKMDDTARLIRNMTEAAQIGYDHILWFYVLNAFDYVNVPNALRAKPSTPTLKGVQDQVRAVFDSHQLGPFANMYWDHPGYKLPPDLDLELTAHYLDAIRVQQKANEATATLGGRFPMIHHYIPGGVTQLPSIDQILFYRSRMEEIKAFTDTVMFPDLLAIAPYHLDLSQTGKGVGNYLTWGVLDEASQDPYDRLFPRGGVFGPELKVQKVDPDQVRRYTKYAWYGDAAGQGMHPLDSGQEPIQFTNLPPMEGEELPQGKYDWTQAVRYGERDLPVEVGPLAQILVAYLSGRSEVKDLVDGVLKAIGKPGEVQLLMSDLGRIAARVIKAKVNADNAVRWSDALLANMKAGKTSVFRKLDTGRTGEGRGGWDGPRGALCHYVRIRNGVVQNYAVVTPSTWNLSPRDDKGVRGPVEEALVGKPVADPSRPLEILRTVHTFDP